MNKRDVEKEQSHWFLAQMGKRVLRPGGKELTRSLIDFLEISPLDHIVEFAPGMGYTAKLALREKPLSYVGIEREEAHIARLRRKIKNRQVEFVLGDVQQTGLKTASKDKVFGEAMLSMHADHRKIGIIKEAARILKPGGWYAIHELELSQKNMSDTEKSQVKKDLAIAARVNARPLTFSEWKALLESQGFKIIKIQRSPMKLLAPKRLIDDEGVWGVLRIGFNVIKTPKALKRINGLRTVFKQHRKHINALAILAVKV